MLNNQIGLLIQAAQGGGDPMRIIGQLAGGNPMIAHGLQMVRGKSPDQLRQLAENMARERGTSPEAILRGLGIRS